MRFSIYQESKKGGRKSNQDRMGYCYTREALLMVVADGMGGHAHGEIAAQVTVQTLGANFQKLAQPELKSPQRFLEESLYDAHREIHHYRLINQLPEAPRTTVVACIVQHGMACWAHVGDSRLYWMRNGEVIGQTRDHSKFQTLIDQGLAVATDVEMHPARNEIFNCLGSPSMPAVELSRRTPLKAGDTLFLCSDGLWSAVPEPTIAQTFAGNTVMRAIPDLIYLALLQAGDLADNVTGMAMTWEGADFAEGPNSISTALLPLGSVTTTIRPDEPKIDPKSSLSDDEIERAIAEIRASISRSSVKNKI